MKIFLVGFFIVCVVADNTYQSPRDELRQNKQVSGLIGHGSPNFSPSSSVRHFEAASHGYGGPLETSFENPQRQRFSKVTPVSRPIEHRPFERRNQGSQKDNFVHTSKSLRIDSTSHGVNSRSGLKSGNFGEYRQGGFGRQRGGYPTKFIFPAILTGKIHRQGNSRNFSPGRKSSYNFASQQEKSLLPQNGFQAQKNLGSGQDLKFQFVDATFRNVGNDVRGVKQSGFPKVGSKANVGFAQSNSFGGEGEKDIEHEQFNAREDYPDYNEPIEDFGVLVKEHGNKGIIGPSKQEVYSSALTQKVPLSRIQNQRQTFENNFPTPVNSGTVFKNKNTGNEYESPDYANGGQRELFESQKRLGNSNYNSRSNEALRSNKKKFLGSGDHSSFSSRGGTFDAKTHNGHLNQFERREPGVNFNLAAGRDYDDYDIGRERLQSNSEKKVVDNSQHHADNFNSARGHPDYDQVEDYTLSGQISGKNLGSNNLGFLNSQSKERFNTFNRKIGPGQLVHEGIADYEQINPAGISAFNVDKLERLDGTAALNEKRKESRIGGTTGNYNEVAQRGISSGRDFASEVIFSNEHPGFISSGKNNFGSSAYRQELPHNSHIGSRDYDYISSLEAIPLGRGKGYSNSDVKGLISSERHNGGFSSFSNERGFSSKPHSSVAQNYDGRFSGKGFVDNVSPVHHSIQTGFTKAGKFSSERGSSAQHRQRLTGSKGSFVSSQNHKVSLGPGSFNYGAPDEYGFPSFSLGPKGIRGSHGTRGSHGFSREVSFDTDNFGDQSNY